jgi:SAM-dependent methyltransferase
MTNPLHANYDPVAAEYAARFNHELQHKPFDCKLLDWLIEKVGSGIICDMGCGPGQVGAYLHQQGASAMGIDLSPAMIQQAQQLHPTIPFQVGDMLALTEIADNTFGGMAAFYSLIHIDYALMVAALTELKRVLRPGGVLLLSFHIGDEVRHQNELLGKQVSLDFVFFQPDAMRDYLTQAGYELQETIIRYPYPDVEYPSQRAYLFARKPS